MNISIFFPLRAGSTRAVKKNTRPFLLSGKSLFQLKIKQLIILVEDGLASEIVISTNDKEVIEQAQPYISSTVKLVERPSNLCRTDTKVVDLINYVPRVVSGEHIFWVHATSPFVMYEDYKEAILKYHNCIAEDNYDSLMSVNKIQQFIWDDIKKKVINVDRDKNPWPNTQDLESLYEINHAFYISKKENYLNLEDRIGVNPALFVCEGYKKIDIDWEEDFKLAQALSTQVYNES